MIETKTKSSPDSKNAWEQIPFLDFFEPEEFFLDPDEEVIDVRNYKPLTWTKQEETILKMRFNGKSLLYLYKYFCDRNPLLGELISLNELCILLYKLFSIPEIELWQCCSYIIKQHCTCKKSSHKCYKILDCPEYPREVWEYTFQLVGYTLPKGCNSLKRLKEYIDWKRSFQSKPNNMLSVDEKSSDNEHLDFITTKDEREKRYEQPLITPFVSVKNYPELKKIINEQFSDYYKEGYKKKQLKRNLTVLAINFIHYPKLAIPRGKSFFNRKKSKWFTYTYGIRAIDCYVKEGLIIERVGDGGYRSKNFKCGMATVYERSNKFEKLFKKIKKKLIEIDTTELPDVTIDDTYYKYLKIINSNSNLNELSKDLLKDKVLSYYLENIKEIKKEEEKDRIIAIQSNFLKKTLEPCHVLNTKYFSKIKLGFVDSRIINMATNVYLSRKFRREGCGRFYQLGACSYQNIPKKHRKYLTINGVSTVECDFSAMHLNLLYAKVGKVNPYPNDSYAVVIEKLIGRQEDELRDAVKFCILVALNAKDYLDYSRAMRWKHYKKFRILKKFNISLDKVIDTFKEVHPDIVSYLHSNQSYYLMLQDSEILQNILLKLCEKDLLGLPLHDAILCQDGCEDEVSQILLEEYEKFTGFKICVKTKGDGVKKLEIIKK